jgi:hypothetical protein
MMLLAALALSPGCASGPSGEPAWTGPDPNTVMRPPAGSPLSSIELGMNDGQVRSIMGMPDNTSVSTTGKSWIPFYYGPDTHRTDWIYKGQGRIIFSRGQWTSGLSVIDARYDPDETAGL